MILLGVAVNLFTRTWFRIRSVTSARQACRKIAVLSLIRSQRQLACEGLYTYTPDQKRQKKLRNLFTPSAIFFVTKFHVFAIMSKATSQAFSSYRRNRTVLSFRERYRLTVFVSNGTVAVMAQRGVSLKSVLTCYEKNKMIFFFIWAVIDFMTINISWFLLNIKQHPSPISRKPQTVLNGWMAWIVCIVLFSYHKCACPMSRAIAATFWPRAPVARGARM